MVDNLRMIMERRLVAREGIEPPTPRFSDVDSKTKKSKK